VLLAGEKMPAFRTLASRVAREPPAAPIVHGSMHDTLPVQE
jgi:hypothetical protein